MKQRLLGLAGHVARPLSGRLGSKLSKVLPIVAGGVIGFAAATQTSLPADPAVHPVSVVTVDGRDYDGIVANGTMLTEIQPVAPIMNWENQDLRNKATMSWCLSRLPDEARKQVARAILTTVYGWYQTLPMWQESCSRTNYFFDDTAQTDCGIGDQAVGCAVYKGSNAFVISFNGNLYRSKQCTISCVRSTLAHEVGHAFNLGHTTCQNVEPSSMSPIILPDGPACASQGVPEPIPADYRDAEAYYGLVRASSEPPVVIPEDREVWLERWTARADGSCCVVENARLDVPGSEAYGWYILKTKDAQGNIQALTDFIYLSRSPLTPAEEGELDGSAE